MPRRDVDDRCPGVLRPFSAADGAIVRLRVPGGRVRTDTLVAVTEVARRFGQPLVQVTSRGNLQLRGLPEPVPSVFVDAVGALGLLPSPAHDRVRNILAEPAIALDDLVTRLDEEIRDEPLLGGLSGRWIFALAVSTSWLDGVPHDVAFQQVAATQGVLRVGPMQFVCPVAQAPRRLVQLSTLFVRSASAEHTWNVSDLPPDHGFFRAVHEWAETFTPAFTDDRARSVAPTPDGTAADPWTALHLPLGMLDLPLAHALAEEADEVVVTPQRSIVVRQWRAGVVGSDAELRLAAAGFVTDEGSAAALFSACIGAPWCRRTTTPTLDITRRAAELVDRSATRRPVRTHVVGCERACGRPATPHRLVVAPASTADVLPPADGALPHHAAPFTPDPSPDERPNGSPRA